MYRILRHVCEHGSVLNCDIHRRSRPVWLLLAVVPIRFLLPALAVILVISAVKVWRHR